MVPPENEGVCMYGAGKGIRMRASRFACLFLAGALVFGAPLGKMPAVYAVEAIEKEQEKTEAEYNDINAQREEASRQAEQLESNAEALNRELSDYTAKLENVNKQIEDTKQAIAGAENDIATLESELAEAKSSEEEQYRSMKERILYFYENNAGKNLLTMILECRSISDIVNTLEYLDQVFAYDRTKLSSYQELQSQIQEKQAKIEESKQDLHSYHEDLAASQSEMDTLVGLKQEETEDAEEAARVAELSVEEYDAQLSVLMDKMNALQSQADAAQAALAKEIAEKQAAAEAAAKADAAAKAKADALAQELLQKAAEEQAKADAMREQADQLRRDAEEARKAAEAASASGDTTGAQIASDAASQAEQQATAAEQQAEESQKKADEDKQTASNAGSTAGSGGSSYGNAGAAPGSIAISESELLLLAATIQAEADNQGDRGRLAVGTVIMNRVESNLFPNTVSGVVQQKQQFASWRSGVVSMILQRGPNQNCINAARQAASGTRLGTWLFFMTKPAADGYGITGYEQIGDHVFFWKWGAN